jgi:replicative DNA helicase
LGKATIGESLLGAVLLEGKVGQLAKLGDFEKMLSGHEAAAWKFIREFVTKHHALPSQGLVEQETKIFLPKTDNPASFYREELFKRYITERVKVAASEAKGFLTGKPDPIQAYEAMMETLLEVHTEMYADAIFDARTLVNPVLQAHTAAAPGMSEFITLGWSKLDEISGGVHPGDLISYVGRPGQGKTWQLLWSARHAWKSYDDDGVGNTVMFVTMEMDPQQILMRLAAIESGVENKNIKSGQMTTKEIKKVEALQVLSDEKAAFYVVAGNFSKTVEDVLLTARVLNPSVVYIDGAYLLRHTDSRLNTYQRVAAVAEQIKTELASSLQVPVICSWQFSRAASKKKDDAPVGLEDIAYSDVIGQLSSIVLGLLEEDSVESTVRKRVDVLKGRGGEQGEFYVNWDFKNMDFSQWEPKQKDEADKENVHTVDDEEMKDAG